MKKSKTFLVALICWLIYSATYLVLKNNTSLQLYAGFLSLIGEAGLDGIIAVCSFIEWRKENFRPSSPYLIIFLSMLFAGMADSVYNIGLNLLNLSYTNTQYDLYFETPFLLFLTFQFILWARIFQLNFKKVVRNELISMATFTALITLLLVMFLFGIDWKIGYFSKIGQFQLADTILEVFGFGLASICLARSKTILVKCLGIGYLFVISSDLIIRYHVVSGITPYLNFFELTWILGLLIISLGFYFKKNTYNNFQLDDLNTLKSQIASWMLVLLFSSTFVMISGYYLFNGLSSENNEIFLLSLAMIVPTTGVVILASLFISSMIVSPLTKLESIIRNFTKNPEKFDASSTTINPSFIGEFSSIEKFVTESFEVHAKNIAVKNELTLLASQVAHDIRSPLITLDILLQTIKNEVPSEKAEKITACLSRIHSIADDLLSDRRKLKSKTNAKNISLYEILNEIVELKKLEYQTKTICFNFEAKDDSKKIKLSIDFSDFKRALSNLINNAVEAIGEFGSITIKLYKNNTNEAIIDIIDTGTGFSPEILASLNSEIISTKKMGNALGLPGAIALIKAWNGKYEIVSSPGNGATFRIIFPAPQ